ncbi:4Fe-4S binding protein [Desulfofalx alkaliphila]|uniref:nucleotide-binding protein n=1 Tax=Desulfofalx alkaliphila TaxID=105483 RepID=UPI0004E0DDA1|nr:4Fe-4S binding protein [Desulfofalx alkaliphila]
MKEVTVVSGKGGTGKTSITAALATLVSNAVICDCDVDAANLHLMLKPKVHKTAEFIGSQKAVINSERCDRCGTCAQLCKFDAIVDYSVKTLACEGCKLCYHVCPRGAVEMVDHLSGHWYISETAYGPFVHAKLGMAEGNSGLLVAQVRKAARELAEEKKASLILTDGPPGIGCPVISSLAGTDLALVVTEPTQSGIHDLKRICDLAGNFDCRLGVCINKADLSEDNSNAIAEVAQNLGVPVLARLPYEKLMHDAVIKGKPVTELPDGAVQEQIKKLWHGVERIIKNIS